jgi:hypothetical protein
MTLILNEIHLLNGLNESILVAASDRRLTTPDGSYNDTRPKQFHIPYLRGAVSYFGLAAIEHGGKTVYFADWLPNFIARHAQTQSLQDFAESLREELHRRIPPSVLKDCFSGFHICGYDNRELPDFWYLSNIGGMTEFRYINPKPRYAAPESHFLDRDAKSDKWGWDGIDPSSANSGLQIYRNGDIRAHVVAWKLLDKVFKRLLVFPDFKPLRTPEDYGKYVRFKFEVIAYFYKCWADKEIIARPIDVLVQPSWTDEPILLP